MNEIIPIIGFNVENQRKEHAGTAFLVKVSNKTFFISAGHVFNTELYSRFSYIFNQNEIQIDISKLKLESSHIAKGVFKGARSGEIADYCIYQLKDNSGGLKMNISDYKANQIVTYRGFSPISKNEKEFSKYVELKGHLTSPTNWANIAFIDGKGKSVNCKVHNAREAEIIGTVQGNSGGPIFNDQNEVIGMVTNGGKGKIQFITSNYVLSKILDYF